MVVGIEEEEVKEEIEEQDILWNCKGTPSLRHWTHRQLTTVTVPCPFERLRPLLGSLHLLSPLPPLSSLLLPLLL
jgi:hypothetical protein